MSANGRSLGRPVERDIAAAIGLMSCVVLLAFPASPARAATARCDRVLGDAKAGATLDPPIALTATPQSAQKQLNFDTDRDPKIVRNVAISSDRPLPASLTSDQINYDAVLSRSGDTLESTDFSDPTFTDPKISPDRRTITFSICLNPKGISAGKYVGAIGVSGPAGLGATSINLTVSAKDGHLFRIGLCGALAVAFALLLLKDAAIAFPNKNNNWGQALLVPLRDLRWWAATAIALGSAFGILYAAYANDPAWGATGLAAAASLVGSAFAAIGGQSILTSFSSR